MSAASARGTGRAAERQAVRRLVTCMATFTHLQGQYLSFIDAYTKVNGRPPAEADLQRYFEVTPPVTHQMIIKLQRLGLVARSQGAARSVRVTIPQDEIPRLEPREGDGGNMDARRLRHVQAPRR